MTGEPRQSAETVRVKVRLRTIPERLRWLADYLESKEGQERLAQLGVMLSLRLLADEIEQYDGDGA